MTANSYDTANMVDPVADSVSPPAATPAAKGDLARILCVDDEPDILASLRALFRADSYSVRIADCAAAGIKILENEPVDIVIADLRMPKTSGAEFLAVVRERWPQSLRMLMTDTADAASHIAAVDSGEVHLCITKPWDDRAVMAQLRQALELKQAVQEKAQVEQRATTRNEELKALNASLEQNVNSSQDELAQVNKRLKDNFVVSLKVFASLIETRRPHLVGHARRVADLARKLATRLQLEPALVQEVFVAGLLHDVGKLAFSDVLLDTPVTNMNPLQLKEYRQHPARAEELLMPLQDLRGVVSSIGAQLERYDGTGFPRKLKARAILVGARILAVCSDYDNLQIGVLAPRKLTPEGALAVIERSSGVRYDPWVVEAFGNLMRNTPAATSAESGKTVLDTPPPEAPVTSDVDEMLVRIDELTIGMILARDLISPGGLMMLPVGHTINQRLIDKMNDFEKTGEGELTIYVRKPPKPD